MPFTLVSFHAHPDDEVLLTGGTLARAAAEGHRVVLVVATNGEAGLTGAGSGTGDGRGLGALRAAELRASAAALGVERVELLGYPDSGMRAESAPGTAFCRLDPAGPAGRLAGILRAEQADVLTIYDEGGGYGHPDHCQVHRVGRLAAEIARTPVVLEATLDRTALLPLARLLAWLPFGIGAVGRTTLLNAYTPRVEITHRVDVGRHLAAKLSALRAHRSQASGGRGPRTAALLLHLPAPLARRVLGREWFVERGRSPGPVLDDVFATVRAHRL